MTRNSITSRRVRVRVIGLGNVLLGDEGVGVHAVRLLRDKGSLGKPGIDLLDGETAGLLLLPAFEEADRVVIIDATADGATPGTITELRPRFAAEYPRTLSAHDVGLRDLMTSLQVLGAWPDITLFAVSIHWPQPLSLEMTPAVRACLPDLVARVEDHVLASHDEP